jgi:ATP-dependent protease HslVU (ClpYQ) peptidase subunit
MSVVVCKITSDKIILASDSRVTNNDNIYIGSTIDKIHKIGEAFIGTVGTVSESNILLGYIKDNAPPGDKYDLIKYFSEFYKYRNDLDETLAPKEKDRLSDNEFILIVDKKAFLISDLFVEEISNYIAIGHGSKYAMGAIENGASISEAINISCKLSSVCGLPVKSITIDKGD